MLAKTIPYQKIPRFPQVWLGAPKSGGLAGDKFEAASCTPSDKGCCLVGRMQRLPHQIRKALIGLYFDDKVEIRRETLQEKENEHCLVRMPRGGRCQFESYGSLPNFSPGLNMAEDLSVEKPALAD
jgi:hypothetical protein